MSDLTEQLEAVVLDTPGVLALYRTGSVVTKFLGAAAERLGAGEKASRITVTEDAAGAAVEIAMGIDSTVSAVDIVRVVHERVQSALDARGVARPRIRLTVVHVADGTPLT